MQGETKVRKGKMRWPESNRIAKSVRWDLRVFREGVKERDGYWEFLEFCHGERIVTSLEELGSGQ